MLALSCTYEMTPHALSCMERDLTLLTLILCAREADTDMARVLDRHEFGVHDERPLTRRHCSTELTGT